MQKAPTSLRQRIQDGEHVIGSFLLSRDPAVVRVASAAGLDLVMLDFEHGTYSVESAAQLIDVACFSPVETFVRCTVDDVPVLGRLLDRGLDGVLVAAATSAEDVKRCVDQVKFVPQGKRGYNPIVPAAGYGTMDGETFTSESDEHTSVWVLAENRNLLSQLDEVCEIEGLDGVFFGPYDLSVDLGLRGQVTHPVVTRALNDAMSVVRSHGLPTGIFAKDAEDGRPWLDQGVQLLIVGADWMNLQKTWTSTVQSLSKQPTGQR